MNQNNHTVTIPYADYQELLKAKEDIKVMNNDLRDVMTDMIKFFQQATKLGEFNNIVVGKPFETEKYWVTFNQHRQFDYQKKQPKSDISVPKSKTSL